MVEHHIGIIIRTSSAMVNLVFKGFFVLFQFHHIALLCKYTGISFISGSVNHGAFSEHRSYITAGIGVVIYLIGAFMDHKNNPQEVNDWRQLFGLGIILSIGLGFFTGGLQHFIDSPERSVWVVPIGFLLSIIALYFLEGHKKISVQSFGIYAIIGLVLVSSISFAGLKFLNSHGSSHSEDGHSHTHAH
jgi:hypothetical protein